MKSTKIICKLINHSISEESESVSPLNQLSQSSSVNASKLSSSDSDVLSASLEVEHFWTLYCFLVLCLGLLDMVSVHHKSIACTAEKSSSSGPSTVMSKRSLRVEVFRLVQRSVLINFKAENVLSMWPFEKGKLKMSSQIKRILAHLPESGATNNLYHIFW